MKQKQRLKKSYFSFIVTCLVICIWLISIGLTIQFVIYENMDNILIVTLDKEEVYRSVHWELDPLTKQYSLVVNTAEKGIPRKRIIKTPYIGMFLMDKKIYIYETSNMHPYVLKSYKNDRIGYVGSDMSYLDKDE